MEKMEWGKLLSPVRLGLEGKKSPGETGRSHFHKDYDRITFCSAFRRLGKKTQVHPLAHNDHVHSRLTHSLEVSSVGRSIGIKCGEVIKSKGEMPAEVTEIQIGQILQAACLGHDIGNPPFGHAGEEAIRSWFSHSSNAVVLEGLTKDQMDDFRYFEGNAQGFRLLTCIEQNMNDGGLRLTYATLASMLKYPWTSKEIKRINKYCVFQSEIDILNKVAIEVGLNKISDNYYCRHPLAYLVEAADDICYRILDLEDAIEMKMASIDDIKNILGKLCEDDPEYTSIIEDNKLSVRRKMAFFRAKSIGKSVDAVVKAFEENYDKIMSGENIGELINHCADPIKEQLNEAKSFAQKHIFMEPRKIELEIGCYSAIGILLDAYCKAVREQVISGEKVSYKSERILSMMGGNAPQHRDNLYKSFLRVTDFISGMTDNYASYMARQIGGMGV